MTPIEQLKYPFLRAGPAFCDLLERYVDHFVFLVPPDWSFRLALAGPF